MTIAAEARTDVTNWFENHKGILKNMKAESSPEALTLVGVAVETAAIKGNWSRSFSDTDEDVDAQNLISDIEPVLHTDEVLPSLVAAVAAKLGYRHNK